MKGLWLFKATIDQWLFGSQILKSSGKSLKLWIGLWCQLLRGQSILMVVMGPVFWYRFRESFTGVWSTGSGKSELASHGIGQQFSCDFPHFRESVKFIRNPGLVYRQGGQTLSWKEKKGGYKFFWEKRGQIIFLQKIKRDYIFCRKIWEFKKGIVTLWPGQG